jgi:hypothetical protein
MGITISYKGKLKSPSLIQPLTDEIADIASIMKWKFDVIDEDFEIPFSARLEHDTDGAHIKGHLPLKGISFQPHEQCETVGFYFDKKGVLRNMAIMAFEGPQGKHTDWQTVKTQFASPEVHITIVKLLKHLQNKYFGKLEIHDDGSYYESGNEGLLRERFGIINMAIDKMEEILTGNPDAFTDKTSADDIANGIENLLNEKWNEFRSKDGSGPAGEKPRSALKRTRARRTGTAQADENKANPGPSLRKKRSKPSAGEGARADQP